MTTVLFAGGGTGGHLMPALAIAQAVSAQHPDWRMFFAGARRGIEAHVLPARGTPHQLFPFEPIHRHQVWRNFRWPVLAWTLMRDVDAMLDVERPAVVIGTGGYVSGPVVWRAARRGIPSAILELDVMPGLATRALAGRVDEVWLGAPEARLRLPRAGREGAWVTGAPITPPDRSRGVEARNRFGMSIDNRPILVVTGGSQGSRAINELVSGWLDAGASVGARIIWATGRATFDQFARHHTPPDVHVLPFIDPMNDAWALADVCVARAGMMTIAELCAWGIPSVLIPLPTAAADHQTHNARALEAAGGAICLPQVGLSAPQFGSVVDGLLRDQERRQALGRAAAARGRPGAAADIAQRVARLAEGVPAARS